VLASPEFLQSQSAAAKEKTPNDETNPVRVASKAVVKLKSDVDAAGVGEPEKSKNDAVGDGEPETSKIDAAGDGESETSKMITEDLRGAEQCGVVLDVIDQLELDDSLC